MKLPVLELNNVDNLQNDPVYLLIINKGGYRVYYAKMSASQVVLLDYKVGDEISFTTDGLAGIINYYVTEIRKMMVKRGEKHEIHLHVEVDSFPPSSNHSSE